MVLHNVLVTAARAVQQTSAKEIKTLEKVIQDETWVTVQLIRAYLFAQFLPLRNKFFTPIPTEIREKIRPISPQMNLDNKLKNLLLKIKLDLCRLKIQWLENDSLVPLFAAIKIDIETTK